MVNLIVEGFEIELSEDMAADITYSLADIRTPDKRQVNFTKTLTLNGTAKNNYAFGFIYDADISNPNTPSLPNIGVNYNPKKLAKAQLYDKGVRVFDGALRLWQVEQRNGILTYEISLFGKLFDIFSEMGDLKLIDLDYSNLNTAITWPNIIANWSATTPAFRFPLIDCGVNIEDSSGKPSSIKFGSMSPAIYHRVYLDKIFSSIGANYILNFSNLHPYSDILVTPPSAKIVVLPNYFSALLTTDQIYISPGTPTTYDAALFADGIVYNNAGFTDISLNKIKFPSDMSTSFQYKFDATLELYPDLPPDSRQAVVSVNRYSSAGVLMGSLASELIYSEERQTKTIEIPRTNFTTGQYIQVDIAMAEGTILYIHQGATIKAISPNDKSEYDAYDGYVYGMVNSVPVDIKQVDFIKDFIKLFNLFVTQDSDNPKTFIFTPYIDFYSRLKSNSIDWSGKVDYGDTVRVTPINQLTAKEYILTWKQDKDYWCTLYESTNKEIYGQMRITSDTDVVANIEKFESIFSPGVLVRFAGSNVIIPAIYKVEEKDGDRLKKPDKFNSRLVIWGGLLPAGHDIELKNVDGTTYDVISSYPYAGHLDNPITPTFDLNFGPTYTNLPIAVDNTYLRYWFRSLFESFNKDGKLISCSMLLRSEDIERLDFSALYRVNNQYYRLNKIEGFNPFDVQTCTVELIKVGTL